MADGDLHPRASPHTAQWCMPGNEYFWVLVGIHDVLSTALLCAVQCQGFHKQRRPHIDCSPPPQAQARARQAGVAGTDGSNAQIAGQPVRMALSALGMGLSGYRITVAGRDQYEGIVHCTRRPLTR